MWNNKEETKTDKVSRYVLKSTLFSHNPILGIGLHALQPPHTPVVSQNQLTEKPVGVPTPRLPKSSTEERIRRPQPHAFTRNSLVMELTTERAILDRINGITWNHICTKNEQTRCSLAHRYPVLIWQLLFLCLVVLLFEAFPSTVSDAICKVHGGARAKFRVKKVHGPVECGWWLVTFIGVFIGLFLRGFQTLWVEKFQVTRVTRRYWESDL